MSNTTFPDFTAEAVPALTDYLVGYRTNVAGGERRTLISSIIGLGSTVTNDDTTNATMYPLWATANTGTLPLYVSSGKMSFNPSTGRLTSTAATLGGIGLTANSLTNVSTLTSPALTDMLVGTGTFGTSVTLASATGIPTFATNVVFSGTTLTVPDAFNINGAGSVSLTAAINKPITLALSGTGGIGFRTPGVSNANLVFLTQSATTNPDYSVWIGAPAAPPVWAIFSEGNTGGAQDYIFANAGGAGNGQNFSFKRSAGTLASPTALSNGNAVGGIFSGYYDGAAFRTSAAISFLVGGTVSSAVAPQRIAFFTGQTTGRSERGGFLANGAFQLGVTGETLNAWDTSGPIFRTTAGTWTDQSSATGTVSRAVFNSFAAPTINATNASVVYTDLFNLYAVAPLTTGNASATRAHTFGIVDSTSAASSITGGFIVAATLGTAATSVGIGGGNINAGGTITSAGATITTTSLLNFGATALGNIGVSADTTSGILQIKSPTSGTTTLYTANALSLTLSGGAGATITGGAGSMTIIGGTGASRTVTIQTTTSGSTATNALVLSATQNATFGGSITTSAPTTGTAGAWKLGILVTTASVLDTTKYIQLDVGGTLYKLATCT